MKNKYLIFFLLFVISIPTFGDYSLKGTQNNPSLQTYKKNDVNDLKDITTQLNGSDPDLDDSDLGAFDTIIGNASIVGLGEGTHGTHEFYQMKYRLLKHLVKKKGFTIFSMETSMANATLLNDYVLYGKGDPTKLVKNLGPAYGTQEILSLLQWMHEYNQSSHPKIQFTGFDFQDVTCSSSNEIIQNAFKAIGNEQAATEVNQVAVGIFNNYKKFFELMDNEQTVIQKTNELITKLKAKHYPPEILKKLITLLQNQENTELERLSLQCINDIKNSCTLLNDSTINVSNEIEASKIALINKFGNTQYNWILQNASLMQQNIQLLLNLGTDSNIVRDKAMAENILWLQASNPGVKIVIWGHNDHVHNMGFDIDEKGKRPEINNINGQYSWMGKFLKSKLGDQYRSIGFLTYAGNYTAIKQSTGDLAACDLQIPPDNALESIVNKLEIPFALINLTDKEHLPIFLKQSSLYRSIGEMEIEDQFMLNDVSIAFDAMIYIKLTSGSQIIPS